MVMSRKKLGIFLTLGLLGILFLSWVFKTPFQSRKGQTSTRMTFTTPIQGRQIVSPSDKREAGRLKSSYSSWGRSPFVPGEQRENFGLRLKGIVWDKENSFAIINEEIVRKGDKIEGKEVIEVERDKIIMNDGQSNFELKLP